MKTTKNYEAGRIILQQLGFARVMLGVKNAVLIDNGVQFKIGRNAKKVNFVSIILAGDDTYTMKFSSLRCKRGEYVPTETVRAEISGVYVDMMKPMIEEHTGMYTSM